MVKKSELEKAKIELDEALNEAVLKLTVAYYELKPSLEKEIEKMVYAKLFKISLKEIEADYNHAILVLDFLELFIEKDEKENFYEIEPGFNWKRI